MSHPERRGTLHKHNHTATVFAFFTVNDSKVSRDVGCQPSAPALSSLPTPPPPSFPFFQPPAPAPRLPGVSPSPSPSLAVLFLCPRSGRSARSVKPVVCAARRLSSSLLYCCQSSQAGRPQNLCWAGTVHPML